MGKGLDIETLRERLKGKSGKTYWRSLEEVANTETFQQFLHREFPKGAGEWRDDAGRRRFLKIMGASLALAGLSGCFSTPNEEIVPYVEQPEHVVPGEPLFFATAVPLDGYAHGVLVESHEGRPTKVEGNPDHPASMGATNALMQASVLDLYDPDRSTSVLERGTPSSWSAFTEAMAGELRRTRRTGGAGFRLLTGPFTSPTQKRQVNDLLERFPQAQWHLHDPTSAASARTGVRRALGRNAKPVYHLEEAEVILSLGSDFLHAKPGSVRYAHAFAERRRVREGEATMNRLYAVESTPTLTGAMADHRLPLPPHRVQRFAQALARRIGASVPASDGEMTERERTFLEEIANDLQEHAGRCVVVPGEAQPAALHTLAHAMNQALDAVGTTVTFIEPVEARPEEDHGGVRGLVQDIKAGDVETLLMLGTNPVYSAPADVDFRKALEQVPTSIHHGLFVDETGERSIWHVPARHYLEDWSDALAFDGTASIIQPLINPLHDACRSAHEVLSIFTEGAVHTSYDVVTAYWNERYGGGDFAPFWQQALHDGVVPGTEGLDALPKQAIPGLAAAEREHLAAAPDTATAADISPAPADTTEAPLPDTTAERQPASLTEPLAPEGGEMELIIKPAPFMRDGAFANNAWLQELPKPITKLVWDNAALVSPSTAEELGVENRNEIELQYQGRSVSAPVWIVPGHADDCVTVHLGYGRTRAGRVGNDAGFSAYRLRTADRPWGGPGLTVEPTGTERVLATTQTHHSMEGRELVREGTLEEFQENPGFPTEGAPIELPSLYEEYEYDDYKWGMVIDSNVCTGCQACVVACQSENNIPVVGKEQVLNGREMHWLRVDRYYKGSLDNPEVYYQPVPCMHCEKAPCEVVCPVNATVHDDEGLNVMVYNRCIGTRYCSNNCPYKVRRFNFLEYNREWDEDDSLRAQNNPDVTVRSRGVMEKCTYCIQRINAARIEAKKENRRIEDGEVLTACQQACPTQAITFGDLNDDSAEVKHLEEEPHNYALLEELGTQPRTTYLAYLRHPNEELVEQDERPHTEQGISPTVGEEG